MRTASLLRSTRAMIAVLVLGACSGGAVQGETADTTGAPTTRPSETTTTVATPPATTTVPASSTTSTVTTSTTSIPPTTTSTIPVILLPTLGEGAEGPEVITLQRMLNNVTGTSLVPDGRFGPDTTVAITNFQRYVQLPVTGVADHETRIRLEELDAGRSTAVPTWPVPSLGNGGADGCQVAVVGDSLMAGASAIHQSALSAIGCVSAVDGVGGRSLNRGWQCRIAQPDGRTPLLLVAEPEPGNTTCAPSGLELLRLWAEGRALGDLVVVALGTNDAGIHTDERTWVAHWDRALELTGGRPVVFLTTAARPGNRRVAAQAAYSASLRRWCDARDRCYLADWALTPAASDPAAYVDGVHLSRWATEQRAAFIAEAVRRLLAGEPAANPTPLPTTTTTTSTSSTTTTSSTSTSTTSSSTTSTVPASSTSTTTTTTTSTTSSTSSTSTTSTTSTSSTTSSTSSTTTVPDGG